MTVPRITRTLLQPFASNSGDMTQFGSEAANNIQYTTDLSQIQALAAWVNGWKAATIANNNTFLPTYSDFDALFYEITSQIAYVFQSGIPEYNNSTTYFTASICLSPGTTILYKSLTDNNIGNPLADTMHWLQCGDLTDLGGPPSSLVPSIPTSWYIVDSGGTFTTNVNYQASQNGLLYIQDYTNSGSPNDLQVVVYSDANSVPTTQVYLDYKNAQAGATWGTSPYVPIKAGNYFRIYDYSAKGITSRVIRYYNIGLA